MNFHHFITVWNRIIKIQAFGCRNVKFLGLGSGKYLVFLSDIYGSGKEYCRVIKETVTNWQMCYLVSRLLNKYFAPMHMFHLKSSLLWRFHNYSDIKIQIKKKKKRHFQNSATVIQSLSPTSRKDLIIH